MIHKIHSWEEYKKLRKCLGCGLLGVKLCEECRKIKKCKVCGIMLRSGTYKIYWNDIATEDTKRSQSEKRKNKNPVKEYVKEVDSPFPPATEDLCVGCVDWKSQIKNKCFICKDKFTNTHRNWISNGNLCLECKKIIYE